MMRRCLLSCLLAVFTLLPVHAQVDSSLAKSGWLGARSEALLATPEEACAYLKKEMKSCSPRIQLNCSFDIDEKLLARFCLIVGADAFSWTYTYENGKRSLLMEPDYTDSALMVAAFRGDMPEARLKGKKLAAYRKACRIVEESKAASKSEYELALALHDYLVENCRYASYNRREGEVVSVLLSGKGVCECYASTYYALCSMAGLECLCVRGKAKDVEHMWNMLRLNGVWVHVDCTWDDPVRGNSKQTLWHIYFGISDKAIAASHQWKREHYPACTGKGKWYAWEHTPHYETVAEFVEHLVEKRAASGGGVITERAYVKEVTRKHKQLDALIRAAMKKHNIPYRYQYAGEEQLKAFFALTLGSNK